MRFVKFLLGTDQRPVVIAAALWSLLLGSIIISHAIVLSTRPTPPMWQAIAAGLILGLLIMPFFFLSVSRLLSHMSAWAALATLAAASLCPLAMWHLGALGVHWLIILAACIGLVVAAFFAGRAVDR